MENIKKLSLFFGILLALSILVGIWIGLSLFAFIFKVILIGIGLSFGVYLSNKYKKQ